jgi:hypothetical protein
MAVIFDNEHRKRLVVVRDINLDSGYQHSVILADFDYWDQHYEDVQEWAEIYHCEVKGTVVSIPDDATLNLFVLRWN